MNGDQTLNIIIKAKDQASATLDKFKGKLNDMQPAFQKMAAVGTASFLAISAVAYKSLGAYAEVERANRQLEHAVIGVSKGTKEQVEQIQKLTQALQKKAGIDADSLNMGVAQLSTFGLQSKSVIELTKSLADLTVNQNGVNATGDQYIASANIMAKAMRGEFGMLQKMGIRFTEHQQEIIKTGTEMEKVAAIQEGFAQNLRETTDTLGGVDLASAKLKRTMEDIQENIGKALVPAFAKLAEKLQPIIDRFATWAENNPDLLAKIIMIAGAIAGLVAVVGFLGMALPAVIAGFTLLAGPIGIVIGIIAALGWTIMNIIKIYQMLRDDSDLIWEGIKIIISEKITAIKTSIVKSLNETKAYWMNVWNGIKDFFSGIWESITGIAQSAIDRIKNFLQPIMNTIDSVISKLASIGQSVKGGIGAAKQGAKNIGNKVADFFGFEHGGTVPGAIGQAVPILAHGGETIIPAGKSGSGNGTNIVLNINYPQFTNKDDTEVVKKQIEDALRDVVRIYKLQPSN